MTPEQFTIMTKITDATLDRRLDALSTPGGEATVIDRIKYLIVLMRKTQAQFGELIDVDPSNMSKILSGRIRLTDRIINRIVINLGVSKNWLVNGSDVPFAKDVPQNGIISSGSTSVNRAGENEGAPVYDIDVTAGCQELSQMFTDDRIIGYLSLPGAARNPVVRVSGNSMLPGIKNGSFLQIRPISDLGPIFWGNVYVVVLEDYRMVKQLRRHPDRNKVILHSFNEEYDDMEIDRLDIKKLYLVEAVFNYDIIA